MAVYFANAVNDYMSATIALRWFDSNDKRDGSRRYKLVARLLCLVVLFVLGLESGS